MDFAYSSFFTGPVQTDWKFCFWLLASLGLIANSTTSVSRTNHLRKGLAAYTSSFKFESTSNLKFLSDSK